MQRKKKITVTVDKAVLAALPTLKEKMRDRLTGGGHPDLMALHGTPRVTTSSLVQMGLVLLMDRFDVGIADDADGAE